MSSKAFPITDVLTVATGIMLAKGADFQGVMDHFYPGIMTIGCAAMQPSAAAEIVRQHPKVREFIRVNGEGLSGNLEAIADFIQLARVCFGDTLTLEGPLEVSNADVADAFRRMGIPDAQEVAANVEGGNPC